MPIPDGSVVITPRQMYDTIERVARAVEQLTSTVDPALSNLRADVTGLDVRITTAQSDLDGHGNRLTAIETRQRVTWAVGGLLFTAAGIVIPLLATR